MNQEWAWAAAVAAIPLIVFGAVELMIVMRRRRYEAIAKRSKGPRRRTASRSNPRRTG